MREEVKVMPNGIVIRKVNPRTLQVHRTKKNPYKLLIADPEKTDFELLFKELDDQGAEHLKLMVLDDVSYEYIHFKIPRATLIRLKRDYDDHTRRTGGGNGTSPRRDTLSYILSRSTPYLAMSMSKINGDYSYWRLNVSGKNLNAPYRSLIDKGIIRVAFFRNCRCFLKKRILNPMPYHPLTIIEAIDSLEITPKERAISYFTLI